MHVILNANHALVLFIHSFYFKKYTNAKKKLLKNIRFVDQFLCIFFFFYFDFLFFLNGISYQNILLFSVNVFTGTPGIYLEIVTRIKIGINKINLNFL